MKKLIQSIVLPAVLAVILGTLSFLLPTPGQLALATVVLGGVLGSQLTLIRQLVADDPRKHYSTIRKTSPQIAVTAESMTLEIEAALAQIRGEEAFVMRLAQILDVSLDKVRQVGSGQVEITPSDDSELLMAWTLGCRRSIDGTGIARFAVDYWKTTRGEAFFDANKTAVNRGVTVRRVIIYSEVDEALRRLVEKQRHAGIKIRTIREDDVPGGFLREVTIFDGAKAQESYVASRGGSESWKDYFTIRQPSVSRIVTEFERLFNLATIDLPVRRTDDPTH